MSSQEAPTPLSLTPAGAESVRAEMRRIWTLALPNIGTTVARMLMGFVDFVMVSWLGTEAQAAISPASLMVFAVLCIGNGIAMSVTTFAAQALGRGQFREAGAFGWQTFYLAAALGILMAPATRLVPALFEWVGHPPAVQAAEIAYCRIALWSVAPAIVVSGLDGFFNGVQRPGVSLMAVIVSLVSNAALNYGLIFGHWGLPAMGVAGAALATVIGWGLRAGFLTTVFLSSEFAREYGTRAAWRPSLDRLRGLLRIGGPTAVQWVLDITAWAVFMTLLMGRYGTATLAATNIGVQYMHISFMPAVGIGMALCSLVGHAIGEGRPALAALRTRAAMLMTTAYMGGVGLLFWLCRRPLVELLSNDPSVIALGSTVMIWAALFQVFDALGITYSSALRGAGDTRWPAAAIIATSWGVFIGGGWLIARRWPSLGMNGPWLMCTAYIMLLGLLLWGRFARGRWRAIHLFAEGELRPALQPQREPVAGAV